MTAPKDIRALVSQWPTITGFAKDVDCGYEAARKMRERNSIAPEHWPNVIAAAEKFGVEGVTYEWLAQCRSTPLPSREPAQ